jgi:hypothetical protein
MSVVNKFWMSAGASAALLVFAPLAAAGAYVESVAVSKQVIPQLPAETGPQTLKMWFDGGKYRLVMAKGDVQIFRDKAIYTLNPTTKRYTKTDQASMDAAFKQAEEAKEKLYALLPPEQREKMKKSPQSNPATERTLKPTTRTDSTAGFTCKVWEAFVAGKKVQEHCVVEIGTLPVSKDLQAT